MGLPTAEAGAPAMKANQIHTLISVDKDFDAIKDIKRIGPEDAT